MTRNGRGVVVVERAWTEVGRVVMQRRRVTTTTTAATAVVAVTDFIVRASLLSYEDLSLLDYEETRRG